MNRALFVGATDISDLLQYISKVIATSGKKVLLVDGTSEEYIRYGTPMPSPNMNVVEFEGFDVAVGYDNLSDIESFLENNQQYDQLIVHCSKKSFLNKSDLNKFEFKFVATSQEKISIERTVEVINSIFNLSDSEENELNISFTQIYVRQVDANMAEDYLGVILESLPIAWSEESYELLFDDGDYAIKVNNQNDGKINIRRLSRNYKKVVQMISEKISGLEVGKVKPAMKHVMRRSFAWGK